jgi:hypothetical protein
LRVRRGELPAHNGPIYMVMRLYWPKPVALNGSWKPPAIMRQWSMSKLGREPIKSEALANVRFESHSGLKSDITQGPKRGQLRTTNFCGVARRYVRPKVAHPENSGPRSRNNCRMSKNVPTARERNVACRVDHENKHGDTQ